MSDEQQAKTAMWSPVQIEQARIQGSITAENGLPMSMCPYRDSVLADARKDGFEKSYCATQQRRPTHSNVGQMSIEELRHVIIYQGDFVGLIPYLTELERAIRADERQKIEGALTPFAARGSVHV